MKKLPDNRNNGVGKFSLGDGPDILLINSEFILSYVKMSKAIELMSDAFSDLYFKRCEVPLRTVLENPENTISLFFKPAFNSSLGRFAVKFLTQINEKKNKNLLTLSGIIMLIDNRTGRILSIMDGSSVTALRTGAVSGLASKLLARNDSENFALFGCGAQGYTQLEAVLELYNIKKIYLFDRDESAVQRLIEYFKDRTGAEFIYTRDKTVLKNVDIISTSTPSTQPLFGLDDLKPGVHINAIGAYKPHMQELDTDIIIECSLYVDDIEACLTEAGDIVKPLNQHLIDENHIRADLGTLINNISKYKRKSSEEITVFKSVGIAIQDLAVANAVYNELTEDNRDERQKTKG